VKTIQLSHFAVALAITALLALALGILLQDAAPAVIFISTLALASISAVVFITVERQ
jgi:hypothetical protein